MIGKNLVHTATKKYYVPISRLIRHKPQALIADVVFKPYIHHTYTARVGLSLYVNRIHEYKMSPRVCGKRFC